MSKKTIVQCDCCGKLIENTTVFGFISVAKLNEYFHTEDKYEIDDMCDTCYDHFKQLVKTEHQRIKTVIHLSLGEK